ncbi:MAG: hypothetical protein FWF29_12970, partial [Treponema sp.]|nr:hypothetical protein [Treponema sp.]
GLGGTLPLLYMSGGVIASRGLYSMRLKEGAGGAGTKIGELDEEFVWERRIGDCYDFGGRGWRIVSIGAEAVEVVPLNGAANYIPFWKADAMFRSKNLSARILKILDAADSNSIPCELKLFLDSQRAAQGSSTLSGSANITIEIIDNSESSGDYLQIVIHTFRGGAINYPLSLALAKDSEEKLSVRIESFANDDSILLFIPRMAVPARSQANAAQTIEKIVHASLCSFSDMAEGGITRGERLFRNRLEITGVFGAAFREAAELSMALPRAAFGKRVPLWITRQRSKRLFDAVIAEDGFPVKAEAWRSCLKNSFDMDGFGELLSEIQDGTVALSFFHTSRPSPFARDLVRMETNALLYEYDERRDPGFTENGNNRAGFGKASLSDQVIEEALGNAALRPRLKPELIADFVSRLRRELPGWASEDELSLSEWIRERAAIPLDEWEILYAALPDKLREEVRFLNDADGPRLQPDSCLARVSIIKIENAAIASLVHRENEKAWRTEALSLLGPWLRYQGPVTVTRIAEVFGVSLSRAEDAVHALAELNEIVTDVGIDNSQVSEQGLQVPNPPVPLICDHENLELLLRLSRRKARPAVKEQTAGVLIPFLALRQGISAVGRDDSYRDDNCRINGGRFNGMFYESLSGFEAPAKLWETEICTARNAAYTRETLDRLLESGQLIWYGEAKNRIGFCAPEDYELLCSPKEKEQITGAAETIDSILEIGFFDTGRDFWEIRDQIAQMNAGIGSNDVQSAIWRLVWQGKLSCETFDPVRKGNEFGFTADEEIEKEAGEFTEKIQTTPFTPGRLPRIPRALRNRWKSGAPIPGKWFSLAIEQDYSADLIDEEALNRDRVRLLIKRYGILARPLLENE